MAVLLTKAGFVNKTAPLLTFMPDLAAASGRSAQRRGSTANARSPSRSSLRGQRCRQRSRAGASNRRETRMKKALKTLHRDPEVHRDMSIHRHVANNARWDALVARP
jgi:hypothetical protein